MLQRALVITILLLVPLAAATTTTWSDPAGDVQRGGRYPAALLACAGADRVDLVEVAAENGAETLAFAMRVADRDAPLACQTPGGVGVPMTPGQDTFTVVFGESFRGPFFEIHGDEAGCSAWLEMYPIISFPDCVATRDGNAVVFTVDVVTWAYDDETGEVHDPFDLRTLEWPAGVVHASTSASPVHGRAPSVSFSDSLALGAWQP